jgi:hypothetical protein
MNVRDELIKHMTDRIAAAGLGPAQADTAAHAVLRMLGSIRRDTIEVELTTLVDRDRQVQYHRVIVADLTVGVESGHYSTPHHRAWEAMP